MNCIDLMSKTSNNAKLQKWSNYDEVHGFDVKTNKNVELRRKSFKTTQIYKSNQNTMNCIDLMSKRYKKNVELHPNHKHAKLQKWSNYDELHRFDVKTNKNVELRPKPFKTTQNYKSDQITMNCIDLMSKKRPKPFKTTQIKQRSNNAKLQKWSNYDEVHGFDVKTNKNVELRRKPFKTTQIYKSYQSTMKCMDLTSKRTKMLSYVANHSKQRKSKKVIKIQWIASIWCQNDKNVELRPKPFQTQQNYKSDQITMNCIDLTSKRSKMFSYVPNHSKQLKPTKVFKLQWTASIWCQKHQTKNNAKLQKWSNYDEVHQFDKWIASIWRRKPLKTTQNYKSDQSTMKCMDLTSKRTKMLSYVANHSKQRKSKKVIKIQWIASIWCQNDKNVELRPKPFETQ